MARSPADDPVFRWTPWVVLAFVALWPTVGPAEAVLSVGALASLAVLSWRRFRDGTALISREAWALVTALFLCYWLPQLLSAFDAIDSARAWREVLQDLRYLPFMWLVAIAVAPRRGRRLVFTGLGIIALAWTLDAVVQAADTAAASIRAVDSVVKLYATIQVEVAWGKPGGSFVGIAQDRADFAFADAIGLSSFPFLGGFTDPDSIPLDYYAQLQSGVAAPLPLLVIEGGWPSVPAGAASASTPAMQARYIDRHAQIIDAAPVVTWFQITFTDLDEAAYGFPPGSLTPFANLGLVDVNLSPKPALAPWDAVFARPRQ